ncbi:MAG: hypothetical protein QMD04_05140 [Anaerolineales bacterium]|nr:hypothetical protein [Anaerolineales bacterium]
MNIVVLISANAEWRAVKSILSPVKIQSTPLGEWFETFDVRSFDMLRTTPLTFFHGGWGKISAAATTQYAIDHFHPNLLVNLGTCGGFEGRIAPGTVILVTKTIGVCFISVETVPKVGKKRSNFLSKTFGTFLLQLI